MFGNLVNQYDFRTLMSKILKLDFGFLRRITKCSRQRVQEHFNQTFKQQSGQWWDIPLVQERWNYLISGESTISHYEYVTQRYFLKRKSLYALSLGCGNGHRELNWAKTGVFKRIDAYDLSKSRIDYATDQAKKKGYAKTLNYRVGNIYEIEMQESFYDVVIVEHSLHHFTPLREVFLKIKKTMKDNGYFIVNEFVGPTRFQWTKKQLEIINGALSILPARYRIRATDASVRKKVCRPSLLRMILTDPSEAVESSQIMPLLKEYFELLEVRPYGGTILHPLLSGIAQNFFSDDYQTKLFLKLCFDIEDSLLRSKELESDFILAVCKKRV